jgi:hypothetical protein
MLYIDYVPAKYINTTQLLHITDITYSLQCALLEMSRYQHFMDFRRFLLKVTMCSSCD